MGKNLVIIENSRRISAERDREFLYTLKLSLLLSLNEAGYLNDEQTYYAESKLKERYCDSCPRI